MITLSPDDIQAIKLSMQVAVTATVIALPPGFAAAYLPALSKMRYLPAFRNTTPVQRWITLVQRGINFVPLISCEPICNLSKSGT